MAICETASKCRAWSRCIICCLLEEKMADELRFFFFGQKTGNGDKYGLEGLGGCKRDR